MLVRFLRYISLSSEYSAGLVRAGRDFLINRLTCRGHLTNVTTDLFEEPIERGIFNFKLLDKI